MSSDHNYNYQKKLDSKKSARASKHNCPISVKYAVEFGNYFRNMPVKKALKILADIEAKKDYLPLVKYAKKVPNRKGQSKRGTTIGRYPVKCAKYVRLMLEEAKANAENKNLDTEKLKVESMFATKGVTRQKIQPMGRIGGKTRESKSTNIEVIVVEA
ncbi:MAG TPA: 50S ribosomal protein L22 [archaeon]|jgi:ribosomal protein uL22|nr:50S ribosomal protein L22 [archaeon]